MKKLHIFIFIIFLSTNSTSQEIITDRPDQTESSSTIKIGDLQIESGALLIEHHAYGEKRLYLPTILIRLGLTKTVELRLLNQFEYNIFKTSSKSGFNNLEVGLKVQLFQQESRRTELAFLSHIVLPTASKLFNQNEFSVINKLCVSHASNNNIGFGYNIGYNYHNNQTGDFTYSLVCGYGISDKINTYIEPYGEISELNKHISNINMGITYLLKKNIQLDYSFGTGLNHTFNFMSIGCSFKT